MDYTEQPLSVKLRKVWRYVQLYGADVTRVKVLGHLHMRKTFDVLPPSRPRSNHEQTVGIIGCGNYSYSNIAYFLRKHRGKVIGACMDVDLNHAASMSKRFGIPSYGSDATAMLDDPVISLVYIASNHASHAEYAIRALERGKSVYIEKPHVVSEAQLDRLVRAMSESNGRVFLGFNRPGSRFGRIILSHLAREQGPGMYNWFVAGHAIDPEHWYFRPEEGGRVLGNLCHWTDFVMRMAGPDPFPVVITPTRGRKSDSDIVVTYAFPDQTIAVISFSAKGHTFEGVKENLSAHRGNCLISMEDYKRMTIEVGPRKKRFMNPYRDHGHRQNILAAYDSVREGRHFDRWRTIAYVANTGWFFLKTREALEANRPLTVHGYGTSAVRAIPLTARVV
jgi:predicted dehydrogenase